MVVLQAKEIYKMSKEITIPDEIITNKIHLIRNKKVMIDRDLSTSYE